jgi:polyhydroxyalkanoate synthesis regulator phasin
MRQDAWRAYLEMALGMTEAPRKKAVKVARRLVGKGGATAEQVQGLADELIRASAANREAVAGVVRVELDRALNAFGLAKAEEVSALTVRVRELEAQLRAAGATSTLEAATPADDAVVAATGDAAEAARAEGAAVRAEAADEAAAAQPAAAQAGAVEATGGPGAPAAVKPVKKAAKKAVRKATKAAPAKAAPAQVPAVGESMPPPVKRVAKKSTRRGPGTGEPTP